MRVLELEIAYLYDAVYPWVKGGAEKRIYELSQRMAARGHTVHCYGMKWWQGENEILRDGVHLHGICQPMPLYSGGRRSMKEAAYFAGKVLSARVDCDIVDCQNFPYLSCFSAKLITTLKRRICSSPGMRSGATTGTSTWERKASLASILKRQRPG